MREIKFRAWHSDHKKMYSSEQMVKDQLTLLTDGRFINVSGDSTAHSIILNSMIPLQYTGLKDAKGNDIYESDLLFDTEQERIHPLGQFHTRSHYQVIWDVEETGYYLGMGRGVDREITKDYEIAGNIYENPELING